MGLTGLLMAWKFKKQLVDNLEGFYVFGLTSDIDFKLNKLPVSININGFIGGGGGANAPDGSGLAYRYAIGLKRASKSKF